MKVRDFMIQDVIKVHQDDTIKDLLNTLVQHKVGGVPVVDDQDRLVGMISDGDILRTIKPRDNVVYDYFSLVAYSFEAQPIEDIIDHLKDKPISKLVKKHGIVKVQENDELETVLQLLAKHHFKKIPVVNSDNKVVGVISRGDVIRTVQKNILQNL